MNKRGSGVFRTIRRHSLALSVWIACYTCFTAPACNNSLYGQGGVRERDKRADAPSSPNLARSTNGRRAKPFRFMVTTTPPAQCRLSITSIRRTKGGNHTMQFKLDEGMRPRLYQGSYAMLAECEGYETYSMIVNVPLDIPSRSLSIALVPLRVQVEVRTTPPEAEVSLGGNSLGRSGRDGSIQLPPLRIGRYQLSVAKEGYIERIAEIDVQKESKSISIDLRCDERVLRFESLMLAVSDDRLRVSFDLYESLARDGFDPARLRSVRSRLLEALNARSLKMLERMGPSGLTLDHTETGSLRELYRHARGLLADEGLEGNPNLTLFEAFWEVKWLAGIGRGTITDQQLTELRSQLARIESLKPDKAYLWFDLARVYSDLQSFDRAEQALRNASDLQHDWAYPYFGLAVLHMNLAYNVRNDRKAYRAALLRAAGEFETAMAKDQNLLQAYSMASFCYADAAQSQKAVAIARQALGIAPESGVVKFALGYAYFVSGRGQYAAARFFLTEALAAKEDRLAEAQATRANELLGKIEGRRHQ